MEAAIAQRAEPAPSVPQFASTLAADVRLAADYCRAVDEVLRSVGSGPRAADIRQAARAVKERFFHRHAAAMYNELTDNRAVTLRLSELVYAAADRYRGLLPTRSEIAAERAAGRQSAKQGLEIDQGFFAAHVLADELCGTHLVRAMLRPKREAEALLAEFRRTGFVDLGFATVERKGKAGHVTTTNQKFLNSEHDQVSAALETAVDLVLMDEAIDVGVLRGSPVHHPKYQGRRVFNAGLNLTHLYYGQISFIEFIIERELGLLNKIYRGHWHPDTCCDLIEGTHEKPWLAVVESFAIGGGCQLLCVMDRVIAEPGAYFNLPASKEGFIPGSANLRLPRLIGIQQSRQGIFFEKAFLAGTPEGMMICDEVVRAGEMDAAIERNTTQMTRAGMASTISNRKALRVGQEPLTTYRSYMAVYCRQQSLCFYDPALIANLEHGWEPQKRKM